MEELNSVSDPITQSKSAVISARGLTRVFGSGAASVVAVDHVSLEVMPGETLAFIGRSGSGKTTLLNLLSGLDQPTSGEASFQGNDLASLSESALVEMRRHKISFIFQSFGLMPLLSAQENVELPLHLSGVGWRERRRRAQETLELVGLSSRARHRPYEMSGGEQQRASIARALVTGAEVMFADEPTWELDTTTASTIAAILNDISAKRGTTVLIATHDPILASVANRTFEMVDGALA
ncbi:MAG: macrolide ABC transporter ATP-binding protein [SAR202 cluster bacterium Io17-Chloro-G7]|nr:MAG: macrolide ABC transporter ATP-binding protein [SAR202 cluster bacterium Io17-Chloro-G7]